MDAADAVAQPGREDLVELGQRTQRRLAGAPRQTQLGMQAPVRVLCGETTLGELVGVLSRLRLLEVGN